MSTEKTFTKPMVVVPLAIVMLMATGITSVSAFGLSGQREGRAELTDEQREILQDAHELFQEGEVENAKALLEEAGIEFNHRGHGNGHGEAIRQAVADNDYTAFVEATEGAPFADEIDRDFFDALVEASALRESGNYEEAREILEELGINYHQRRGHRGFGNLTEEQRETLRALKKTGDREAVREFLLDEGITPGKK